MDPPRGGGKNKVPVKNCVSWGGAHIILEACAGKADRGRGYRDGSGQSEATRGCEALGQGARLTECRALEGGVK